MVLRYIVPGLAVLARLAAAQDDCGGTTTISTAAEATALSACSTYNGDIWIDSSTSEDIALNGIGTIKGNLLARNVKKMTSLSADSLEEITDTFGLDDLVALTTLGFPMLTDVDTIIWQGLPGLSSLTFTEGLSKASILSIQNTNLASLEGIDLDEIDQLYLANNFFLDEVSMPLETVSVALAMSANGRNLAVDFPNLEVAGNLTFRNVSSLKMPSLAGVNGSVGFYSNFFEELDAPNLTTVGGSLSFVSNGALTDISMAKLESLGGGLQLANNTKLMKVDGFPKLEEVDGDVNMFGVFTSVTLPSVNLVKGAFNLQSSNNLGNTCSKFQAIAGPNEDIRGTFTCKDQLDVVPGTDTDSSGDGGDSNSAHSILIPYATGIIGVVAAVFGML